MKVSDWIVSFFARKGTTVLFGYIGGMATHLIDSAAKNPDVRFIQTYHEQSAAFAAEGYARATGLVGVAIATSGPGATNMLTGVGNAFFDSIPVIYVTGQVNTYEYKQEKPIRQQGFQETDIVSMAKPVTKYSVMIEKPEDVVFEFEKAWHLALSGRPGPVLLDLPMNVSRAEIEPAAVRHFDASPEAEYDAAGTLDRILSALSGAARPLLLIGGGCHHENNRALLEKITDRLPYVVSLQGKGSVSENKKFFMGMLGSYGNRTANLAVASADLLIVLGSRLDTRQTGAHFEEFSAGKRILQVDVDENEMKYHRLPRREVFFCPVHALLEVFAESVRQIELAPSWLEQLDLLKRRYSQEKEVARFVPNSFPYEAMFLLSEKISEKTLFFADIGQNQMWAAQGITLKPDQDFLTSGGMAPMGYAVPAAAGACFAANAPQAVFAITGDGGFQMALQTLPLISQYHLPLTIVVMNNESLGMITQFQALYFHSLFAATTPEGGYAPQDLKRIAEAFHLPYQRVSSPAELQKVLSSSRAGGILEVRLSFPTTVSPKLEYNRPFYDMSPALPEDELNSILKG